MTLTSFQLRRWIRPRLQSLECRIVPVCPYGPVFAANTSSPSGSPAIAMDNEGDYVVTYSRYANPNGFSEVFARRFDKDNNPLGPEFQVNTETAGEQYEPDVAMDANGDFVIVWNSGPGLTKGQRYDSMGTAQGTEFLVHSSTNSNSQHPAIAMDDDGDFVVVWEKLVVGQRTYARLFESDGTPKGSEFVVPSYSTHVGGDPAVAMDADGDFVVVWRESVGFVPNQTGYIWGRLFDELGTAQGDDFNINTATNEYNTFDPAVAMDAVGDFVVTWSLVGPAIQARQYTAAGIPLGPEFMVNDLPLQAQRYYPSVAMDHDGNFTIVWQQIQNMTAPGGIMGQSFGPAGNRNGGQFTAFQNAGDRPDVAYGVNQDFVVAWGGYFPNGTSPGPNIGVQQYVGPPRLMSVDISDGSAQRSLIKSITVRFCEEVDFTGDMANAFQLMRTGPNEPTGAVQVYAVQSGKDVVLTFGTGGAVGLDPGASLIDGNYQLTVVANSILGSSGLALDGDNDRLPGGNYVLNFHRLFGDANGDRLVSAIDFAAFRLVYGTMGTSLFDFNNDGFTSADDFSVFRGRYGIVLLP